jgi:hypothetical protein
VTRARRPASRAPDVYELVGEAVDVAAAEDMIVEVVTDVLRHAISLARSRRRASARSIIDQATLLGLLEWDLAPGPRGGVARRGVRARTGRSARGARPTRPGRP